MVTPSIHLRVQSPKRFANSTTQCSHPSNNQPPPIMHMHTRHYTFSDASTKHNTSHNNTIPPWILHCTCNSSKCTCSQTTPKHHLHPRSRHESNMTINSHTQSLHTKKRNSLTHTTNTPTKPSKLQKTQVQPTNCKTLRTRLASQPTKS